jgi:hypothetical protein
MTLQDITEHFKTLQDTTRHYLENNKKWLTLARNPHPKSNFFAQILTVFKYFDVKMTAMTR